jgi:hypothetical protein
MRPIFCVEVSTRSRTTLIRLLHIVFPRRHGSSEGDLKWLEIRSHIGRRLLLSLLAVLRYQSSRINTRACIVRLVVLRDLFYNLLDFKLDVPRGDNDILILYLRVNWFLLFGMN